MLKSKSEYILLFCMFNVALYVIVLLTTNVAEELEKNGRSYQQTNTFLNNLISSNLERNKKRNLELKENGE